MMNITILAVGKLSEPYWQTAQAEYHKRLRPYAKVSIVEIKEEGFRSSGEHQKVKKKEAEKIQSYLSSERTIITLSEDGKRYDSVKFATFLDTQTAHGMHLIFVIGGPLGLDDPIKKAAHHTLSLSHLTFPHQLARIVLLEQLYRAVTIQKRKQYHY